MDTRPYVILHSSISVGGRTTGFTPDVGLHYRLANTWRVDVHLVGSGTLLAQGAAEEAPGQEAAPVPPPSGPLLVVPDSRGRIRGWSTLLGALFWRGAVVLHSCTTPDEARRTALQAGVQVHTVGEDRVDLGAALDLLASVYGAKTVLADSGGSLSSTLLDIARIDELSLLVHPYLAAAGASSFLTAGAGFVTHHLRLISCEVIAPDTLWMRYSVRPERQM